MDKVIGPRLGSNAWDLLYKEEAEHKKNVAEITNKIKKISPENIISIKKLGVPVTAIAAVFVACDSLSIEDWTEMAAKMPLAIAVSTVFYVVCQKVWGVQEKSILADLQEELTKEEKALQVVQKRQLELMEAKKQQEENVIRNIFLILGGN